MYYWYSIASVSASMSVGLVWIGSVLVQLCTTARATGRGFSDLDDLHILILAHRAQEHSPWRETASVQRQVIAQLSVWTIEQCPKPELTFAMKIYIWLVMALNPETQNLPKWSISGFWALLTLFQLKRIGRTGCRQFRLSPRRRKPGLGAQGREATGKSTRLGWTL